MSSSPQSRSGWRQVLLAVALAACGDPAAPGRSSSVSAGGVHGSGGTGNGAWGGTGAAGTTASTAQTTREPALSGQPCTGYTLIGIPENDAGADFTAMLVDMDGTAVHHWTITGFPPKMLPGGSLIGCAGVVSGSYDCAQMRQVSWDGALEWSFSDWVTQSDGSTVARQHHDFEREGDPVGYYAPGQVPLAAGSTLVLAHATTVASEIRTDPVDDDVIYEVDARGTRSGFEWHGVDHFAEFGFDDLAKKDLATRSAGQTFEWLHGNTLSRIGPNRWFDQGRSEFDPDNIIYSSRHANFVVILSHETGDVVWRIGPDFAGRPEQSLGQFAGQHSPHLIPRGLPGAGNMLVFDNGGASGYGGTATTGEPNRYSRGYSRVLEFDPVTFAVVWEYGAASGEENFFSRYISNAQRLPNGNTLIAIGNETRVIEVTPDKKVVWEYKYNPTSSGAKASWLYRAYREPPEWLPPGENDAFGGYATWASLFE